MNTETIISLSSVFIAVLSLVFAIICFKKQQKQGKLIEFAARQIEDLEETLAKNKETLETNAQRVAEQSRRIAWLETRVRQTKPSSDEVLDDTTPDEALKLNMTERRHRVITLASRGQDAKTIAATLGMLPGEVELIINLNRLSQTNK
jgi:septal ring factor EnvC (AmiA/AmiB activator)